MKSAPVKGYEDRIEVMRENERLIEKTLTGLSGGISRGKDNLNALSYHQLYNLNKDRAETHNLVDNPEYAGAIEKLRAMLKKELLKFEGRPYGEFVPGVTPKDLEHLMIYWFFAYFYGGYAIAVFLTG